MNGSVYTSNKIQYPGLHGFQVHNSRRRLSIKPSRDLSGIYNERMFNPLDYRLMSMAVNNEIKMATVCKGVNNSRLVHQNYFSFMQSEYVWLRKYPTLIHIVKKDLIAIVVAEDAGEATCELFHNPVCEWRSIISGMYDVF